MSATIKSDNGELWFTNSRAWSLILEEGMRRLDTETRDEYEWYADSVGIDFSEIQDDKRRAVARWLLGVVDDLKGELGVDLGWNNQGDHVHFDELSEMMRDLLRRSGSSSGREA